MINSKDKSIAVERVGEIIQNLNEKGNVYFTGKYKGKPIFVMCNYTKKEEEEPDFYIYESKEPTEEEIIEYLDSLDE